MKTKFLIKKTFLFQIHFNMVNSVSRAADILMALGEGKNRLSDISKTLNMNSSTTHHVLKTLEKSGLVIRDPFTHKYLLGGVIHKLSSNPLVLHQLLVVSADEEMRKMRDLTGETITLHMRIGAQRICLYEVESYHRIKFTVGKGSIYPIYIGSPGKILLSELDPQELKIILNGIQLIPVTPKTITSKNKLLKQLEKIRSLGYATSAGELLDGGISLSVAIKNYFSPISLSVLGPKFRLEPHIFKFLAPLKSSAKRISGIILSLNQQSIPLKI
jgi:DNA-binding IclR family transcriptional regulator